jgi:predicted metal-dependent phosphoesterase TrpH
MCRPPLLFFWRPVPWVGRGPDESAPRAVHEQIKLAVCPQLDRTAPTTVPSLFDLHVHTNRGSPDSALDPHDLVAEAKRIGLTGVVVTEHNGWPKHDFELFANDVHDLVMIRALEVYTPLGHVLAFGLDSHIAPSVGGIEMVERLRGEVDRVGGALVIAHPFRFLFNPAGLFTQNKLFEDPRTVPTTAEQAAEHPVFGIVHEVEVVNGGGTRKENQFAHEVVSVLGIRGTGGSDAHSVAGLGKGTTAFPGDIRNERDLLDALRAADFHAVEDFHVGRSIAYMTEPPTP